MEDAVLTTNFFSRMGKQVQKGALLGLGVVASACHRAAPWQATALKEGASARLSYQMYDRVHGVGVEMVSLDQELHIYLEVHFQKIPPHQGDEEAALVKLKTASTLFEEVAHRHEGGQRVTLTPFLRDQMVEHLLRQEAVTLELPGYCTTLSPTEFVEAYERLQHPPRDFPFQLPFKF